MTLIEFATAISKSVMKMLDFSNMTTEVQKMHASGENAWNRLIFDDHVTR